LGRAGDLAKTAARLGRAARARNPRGRTVPSLFFLTDPIRTPDPASVIAALPAGAGVIYRAFGATDAEAAARPLRALARARRVVFLVGADERLAARLGADGLHLPERLMARARRVRARRPDWLITAAAHGPGAVARAARLGLDAVLVSTVFASASPSASPPMGVVRFAALARSARLPVVALGGVEAATARRLARTHAAGLAAIGGLSGG